MWMMVRCPAPDHVPGPVAMALASAASECVVTLREPGSTARGWRVAWLSPVAVFPVVIHVPIWQPCPGGIAPGCVQSGRPKAHADTLGCLPSGLQKPRGVQGSLAEKP